MPLPVSAPGALVVDLGEVEDRRPGAPGLDARLAAVVRELRARGVLTGTPQRTDHGQRLLGSIVLDCTAVRVAAWADDPAAALDRPLDAAHPPPDAHPAAGPPPICGRA